MVPIGPARGARSGKARPPFYARGARGALRLRQVDRPDAAGEGASVIAEVTADSPGAQKWRSRFTSNAMMRAFFLAKLPMAAMAGLKMTHLDGQRCEVTIPYGWRTQNPFGSIYFAALTMAAELSCAGLALMAAWGAPRPVSVLPIHLEGNFDKKATAMTRFTCEDGAPLFAAVNEALRTGQGVTYVSNTVGKMDDGTVVARFRITWSFKEKSRR